MDASHPIKYSTNCDTTSFSDNSVVTKAYVDKILTYTEDIAEKVNNNRSYNDYLAKHLDKLIQDVEDFKTQYVKKGATVNEFFNDTTFEDYT